uniref:WAT1-related protein n=1 Tax=Opuntia streptacantha TaxID=393608 RepID=A0A7C9A374_OPUST
MKYTSAVFSTAFANLVPVTTFLLALLLRQESVNLRSRGGMVEVLGSLICIGGVVLLILYRGIPLNKATHSGKSSYNAKDQGVEVVDNSPQRWILGSTFLLISIVCWSGWFLIQARIGKRYPCKYSSTAFMSFFGAIQSAILCFAVKRDITIWIVRGKLEILTVLFACYRIHAGHMRSLCSSVG